MSYTIEMIDANGEWQDELGVGREEFETIADAVTAIHDLHEMDDETFHRPARVVTMDGCQMVTEIAKETA